MQSLIIVLLLNILFLYTSLYEMQMLQQNSYNENQKFYHFFLSDVKNNPQVYLLKYLFAICLLLFKNLSLWLFIFFIIIMLVLIMVSYLNYVKHNDKLPLKFTKRLVRIMLLDYLIFILFEILFVHLKLNYYAGIMLLYISLNSYILIICVFLLKPIEKIIFNHYKKKALNKLNKMNNLKIIGITGSFGKTSTKMILESILKTTYKGFYTPASFNTPNGLLLTINNEPTIFNDYFIAEMGAKKLGEIKELCDLVHPKYGILTSIGEAHLETFKSLENICKTKFELIESLPTDGIAILNKDDEYQRKYQLKNKCKVIWISIEKDADVMAQNIKITSNGTTFDIYFKQSNEKITVNTILLGNKNVYNILESAALAKYLSVSNKNIIHGIKNIAPISHRLELKKVNNFVILDDSFNSNPKGAANALEVLSLMEGAKYIITPGMIEMGAEQEVLNQKFGEKIASVCDKAFLVGPKQTKPIYDGLISKKYKKENIIICKSFKEAYSKAVKEIGNKKATILLENDLPDSYTEE